MELYRKKIEDLRNREVQSIEIEKDEFLAFRQILVNEPDFKHFRGEAKQGGNIVFTYLDIART
ncbi:MULTISPECIES: hypothetical protein [Bacillales]|uniref:Acetyltransferase n=1 Tax=Lysinibacillus louembei TaxID=1470088 RepID=A0ABZ0RVE3_9BACI|nr:MULTISPECIES: hypothetical protein [Bacillales]MCT6924132.1 hypothetical protein [Metasolibacillus sp.]MCT6940239.1 hypothetical protein [Metasolibacillus sp.]WPK12208.1 hypothetical protein R6U77_00545 [Lysinibacillus louembei]